MSDSSSMRYGAAAAVSGVTGPALLGATLLAGVVVFWSGLASLVDAWALPEYSHGPIIPLISTFLFLREMRGVPPSAAPVTDRWPGVALVALSLMVGVVGSIVRIPDIVTYGFIGFLAGLILIAFGFRRGLLFWPAVLHLVFMLPLPQFIYWQVSIYLQGVSSELGVALIMLFRIPVHLDGHIIDLGVYKLLVAEACSGLRYLFPMLSFSYVFAVLYQGPTWHKVTLLLLAAPITVMMNSFRIGMIGVLVNSYGIEHAEGFLHTFEGWIIFVACVLILFLAAIIMQQFTPAPKRLSETLDIEFEGLGDQARRFFDVAPSAALKAATVATLLVAVAGVATPEREMVRPDRDPLVMFPKQLGDWRGAAAILEPAIEQVLGADDYYAANYVNPQAAAPVDLFIAYYHKQTEGSGIHSPEVCIPAGGWEVSEWRPTTVTLSDGETVTANRAVIQKGVSRQIVYFWFEQRGRRMISDYAAKAVTVLDSLRIGRTDGGLVRVITPIAEGESEANADMRLVAFLEETIDTLPRFMPH